MGLEWIGGMAMAQELLGCRLLAHVDVVQVICEVLWLVPRGART